MRVGGGSTPVGERSRVDATCTGYSLAAGGDFEASGGCDLAPSANGGCDGDVERSARGGCDGDFERSATCGCEGDFGRSPNAGGCDGDFGRSPKAGGGCRPNDGGSGRFANAGCDGAVGRSSSDAGSKSIGIVEVDGSANGSICVSPANESEPGLVARAPPGAYAPEPGVL